MVAPFRFLDRIPEFVGPADSVLASVRALVLPGGDRPVTRASDASRIPAADVAAHVRTVALDLVTERLHEGLTGALREHFDGVRAEFELLEGECPANMIGTASWREGLHKAMCASFAGSDLELPLSDMFGAESLVDAVLSAPVEDPEAVLARLGVGPAEVDAIVAEVRRPPPGKDATRSGWSIEWLGTYLSRQAVDPALLAEGVAYVLTDPDMVATGAELLGLAGDPTFAEWATCRLMMSTDEENAAAAAEVLRVAGATEEGDEAIEAITEARNVTATGADEGAAPVAQPEKPKCTEESDMTRAVRAALAALFDHGCESDKAMAAALGVDRSLVAGARKGTAHWTPDAEQFDLLDALVAKHLDPLIKVREQMEALGTPA